MRFFLLVGLLLLESCLADDASSELSILESMPQCGITCVLDAIQKSTCSETNVTCLCTDHTFYLTVEGCISTSCNVTDELEVVHDYDKLCHIPKRSKSKNFYGLLVIEIPAWSAIFLRLATRWHINMQFAADDWIMMVVAIIYPALVCIGLYSGLKGFGVDLWEVGPNDFSLALELFYISEPLYITILSLAKISILLFYLRIFPNPRFRAACWVVIAWAITNILFVFLLIFQCRPISAAWESWKGDYPEPYRCFDVNALAYAAAAVGISQDLAIIIMPFTVLLSLNMNWRRKLRILIMFSLGLFALITSCVRLRFIVIFARSKNPSWDYFNTAIWSMLEVAVSVLVTSLPALWMLVITLRFRVSTMRERSGSELLDDGSGPKGVPGFSDASRKAKGKPARSPASRLLSELSKSRIEGDTRRLDASAIEMTDRS